MPTMNFDQVWEAVKTLAPDEMQRLRNFLDILLTSQGRPQTPEEEVEQELLKEGILDYVPPPITDYTSFQNYKPITIEGKPVSETIIEERR